MNLYQSSKKMAALFMTFIMISVIPFTLRGEDPQQVQLLSDINQIDGVYYTETFENTNLSQCIKPSDTNKVMLDPNGSSANNYNFSTWTNSSLNRAYHFNSIMLNPYYPMEWHTERFENAFSVTHEYGLIGEKDDIYFPLSQFAESSQKKQMHHFKFKITQDVNTTTMIQGTWYGKVQNCQDVSIYVWRQLFGVYGYWDKVVARSGNQTTLFLGFTISEKLPIQSNGYVDICVVLTPTFSDECILFTDFVNLMVQGEGYASDGYVQSPIVTPNSIAHWGYATWEDYKPAQTDIKYHIYFQDVNGTRHLIDDANLSGNSKGFTQSPIDLYSIPKTYNISIQANFSTLDLSISPELYSWGLSWQTTQNLWKDEFTTSIRVAKDDIRNVKIEAGKVTLLPSINNWPMFGQNPNNTRVTPGLGPGENDKNLAWYTMDRLGGDGRNPIVQNGVLYIASDEGKKILSYNALQDTGWTKPNIKLRETPTLPYEIKTSPAVTSKGTIVVGTASSSPKGDIKNLVCAFDMSNLGVAWTFKYENVDSQNPYICYESSPVVYDNRIYLTTWGGDTSILNTIGDMFNFSKGNNKLICLSDTGSKIWTYDLPAGSFSSPAVTNATIIVGCENLKGSSLYAFYPNGTKIWEKDVGPIGYASPVIYKNITYVVSKIPDQVSFTAQSRIVALGIENGNILWNETIGDIIPDVYGYAAYNTPAVADDRVFVVSSDGHLHAFDYLNGEQKWEAHVYKKGLISNNFLTSSPTYANGRLYVATPEGNLHVIFASTGSILWTMTTNLKSPISSSPVVVDGLVFITTDNGMLECFGNLQLPENQQIIGSAISRLIRLPDDNTSYVWDRFSATTEAANGYIKFSILNETTTILLDEVEDGSSINVANLNGHDAIRLKASFFANTNGKAILHNWSVSYRIDGNDPKTIFYENTFIVSGNLSSYPPDKPNCSIQVRNEVIGIWNTSAKFKLQYYNSSGQQITSWLPANCTGINGSKEKENITVNVSGYSSIRDVTRYELIKFSILDSNGTENFSNWMNFPDFIRPDTEKPIFNESSFTPASRYITSPTPICTIKAKDKGVANNTSGMNVFSAEYTIEYKDQVGTKTHIAKAQCTGTNNTTDNVTITANIALINFSNDIKDVDRIKFTIKDMANNSNSTDWFNLILDDIKPMSNITNGEDIPTFCNTSPVVIKANASDAGGSGIQEVSLYYRLTSSVQWSKFGSDDSMPYQWSFSIGTSNGGEYELCSIAKDNASNEETFPLTGEVLFVFDPNPPLKPTFANDYEFTIDEPPVFTDVVFKDDYRLKQVSYRMSFDGINEWTALNTADLNIPTYTPTWNLTSSQWNVMIEDQLYHIYFKLTDNLGNTYETPSVSQALTLVKNLEDKGDYEIDISDFDSWSWNNEYAISVDVNESQVSLIQLWYSFSLNETVIHSYEQYGENLTNGSSSWTFVPDQGTGYYSFYVKVIDIQGQEHLSNVKTVYVTVFPLMELMIFVLLLVILFAVSAFIFKKYKKKI
ncbi:MAG: PQQ-binding-like beta-propeller repeat protein [Thermoplasmatota archaeon]